jgi:hypothetical protein
MRSSKDTVRSDDHRSGLEAAHLFVLIRHVWLMGNMRAAREWGSEAVPLTGCQGTRIHANVESTKLARAVVAELQSHRGGPDPACVGGGLRSTAPLVRWRKEMGLALLVLD